MTNLLLETDTGDHYVCAEYRPKTGRLYVVSLSRYALFDREEMVLDYDKVAVPIVAILYEGTYPDGISPYDEEAVKAYVKGTL
jgi:hypothetical protein